MITKELLPHVKESIAITPTAGAAAQTDIEGTTLDMAGFDGVLCRVVMGTITSSAVTGIVMQQSDASNMANAENLAGTSFTVADDDDGQMFVVDLFRPTKRYVRVHVDRGTANAVVAAATYTQYGGRTYPMSSAVEDSINVLSAISPAAAS